MAIKCEDCGVMVDPDGDILYVGSCGKNVCEYCFDNYDEEEG